MLIRFLSFAFLQFIVLSGVRAEKPALKVFEQDGILVSLLARKPASEVRWQFLKMPANRRINVSATVNDRPLAELSPKASSEPEASSLTLLLLDLTDPRREAQILRDKFALLKIAGRGDPQHKIGIASYANEFQLLVPKDGKIGTLVNMVAGCKSQVASVDLDRVLYQTMDILASTPARRRAIFVLTDGHSDQGLHSELLALRARAGGISLNFILTSSQRSVDFAALEQIAAATGGLVVQNDTERELFLQDPFQLLDSGGAARFSLDKARRYIWESSVIEKVVLQYDGGRMELVALADVPLAGVDETVFYAWDNYRLRLVLTAIGVLALLSSIAVFVARKRKKKKAALITTNVVTKGPSPTSPPRAPLGARVEHESPSPTSRPQASESAETEHVRVISCEEMWGMLLQNLRRRGILPLHHNGLTPAEIADHVCNVTKDVRVQTFVRSYYYPHTYGNEQGRMSYAEALELVNSLVS